jgi:hypothetical protein
VDLQILNRRHRLASSWDSITQERNHARCHKRELRLTLRSAKHFYWIKGTGKGGTTQKAQGQQRERKVESHRQRWWARVVGRTGNRAKAPRLVPRKAGGK